MDFFSTNLTGTNWELLQNIGNLLLLHVLKINYKIKKLLQIFFVWIYSE